MTTNAASNEVGSTKTGLVWHEYYMWHDTGSAALELPPSEWVQPDRHIEQPETKRRLKNLLDVTGLSDRLHRVKPKPASEQQILRVHTERYLQSIQRQSRAGHGNGGTDAPFGARGYDIAALSAGGVIQAAEQVWRGELDNAYALVRPPGHHAEPDEGKGFCLFANIAIAIKQLQAQYGLDRIAVVDWDVHHGNGTEAIFYDDATVLTISIHQDRLYPLHSGALEDNGAGAGKGYNLNIPLPAGRGHGAYCATFEQVVIPALQRFEPQLVFVASGFDGSVVDPLARMMCHSDTYRLLTRSLMQATAELCAGKLVLAHEGGYSAPYVPFCGLAVLEELSAIKTPCNDPLLAYHQAIGGQDLQPHQAEYIQRAARLLAHLG